jgi:hypothetical protein
MLVVGAVAVGALVTFGLGNARATDFTLQVSKGCDGPAYVGDPYNCHSHLTNQDDVGNSYVIHSLTDRVSGSGGTVAEDLFALGVPLVFVNNNNVTPVSCTNGTGLGTTASPFIPTATTTCTLPGDLTLAGNGGRINVGNTPVGANRDYSVYTVQPGDFTAGQVTDQIEYDVTNACNVVNTSCDPTFKNPETASGSTTVMQRKSQASTTILDAGEKAVTTVAVGSIVHDSGSVSEDTASESPPPINPGPVPTGNVSINFFHNGNCSGGAADSGTAALDGSGNFDATGMPETVNTAGMYSFQATYGGDGTYSASPAGPCEPLQVVDANISITPNGTNRVGASHTFTAHVNVNDGSGAGFVNAPDGTQISFSIDSGPGSFTTANPCTTSGGTGSCQITLSSSLTGVTTVSAHTTISVGGVSLTRNTDGTGGNSGPAVKTWVNARIHIAPSATNEINHSHTFTVTLEKDIGDGNGFVPAAGEHVDVTLTDSNGATHTAPTGSCTTAGPNTNASGQCTITFSSPTAGQVTGHATSTLSVAGSAPFTVQTDGVAPNGPDAVKTFVDANIQISPLTATDTVGDHHVLTGHVNVNDGSGAGYVNAPDGTTIQFSLMNSGGATATFVGPSSCTTSGGTGSCTVTISSPTAGTTMIHATTTLSLGGVSLTRATGDSNAGDSADAQKIWIAPDANIQISPLTATDAVGDKHTLTGHVNVSTDSTTFTNAPDGTVINFVIVSGPGSFVGGVDSCTTSGGTGSCTVQITSATVGTTVVKATTDVTVSGVTLHRETDGTGANSGPASKNWVDANINITPANAENPVGTNHVLTITVNALGGTIDPGSHTATASIVSGPGSFVGSPSCTYTGGAATASCTVTITSSTAGTTVISATSDIPVGGVTITRTTGTSANTASGGSDNANKVWGDDQISTKVLAGSTDVTGSTTITPGTIVHDEATVTATAGTPASVPAPTGTVTFTLYNGTGCNGSVVSTDPNEPLSAGGVADSATFTTPSGGGPFSYLAHYNGDSNYPAKNAGCEPFTVQTPSFGPALTPGFWKNHQAATTALLPITLGNYNVNTFAKAVAVFDAMKCSAPIDCLAGHELAAKLDLKGGSNPSITPVIAQADALLIAVNYNGPGNYTTPTAAQKALALQLETLIDAYTNQ